MEVLAFNFNQQFNNNFGEPPQFECSNVAIEALSKRLEKELRHAKRALLQRGQVLLPNRLTRRVAEQVLEMADSEPCGLRGCCIYFSFEGLDKVMAKIRLDPATPVTFELYLTLKQAHGWNDFLPQFLKKMTRGGTIVISSTYGLQKRKLYRSYDD